MIVRVLGILLATLAMPAVAQTPPDLDPESSLAFGTIDERMTVPVRIADRGPWPFVVDTGAERTVIARPLADLLQLAAGPGVRLTSMTGERPVATAIIPALEVAGLPRRTNIRSPVLEQAHLGAQGLLGLDALAGLRVIIDFPARRMRVTVSGRDRVRAASDEIVVTARSRFGQLIVTDADYGGRRIRVILDTSASVTVGNSAMRRLVSRHLAPAGRTRFLDVTGGSIEADYTTVSRLRIGSIALTSVPVAFADVAPFARFGIADKPAIMLGMDALKAFRTVEIDFSNRRIRLGLPRAADRENAGNPP